MNSPKPPALAFGQQLGSGRVFHLAQHIALGRDVRGLEPLQEFVHCSGVVVLMMVADFLQRPGITRLDVFAQESYAKDTADGDMGRTHRQAQLRSDDHC